MAVMRSKMRPLESTTVSAMRSTLRELAKVEIAEREYFGTYRSEEIVEHVDGKTRLGKSWSDAPGIGDVMGLKPACYLCLVIACVKRAAGNGKDSSQSVDAVAGSLSPCVIPLHLFVGVKEPSEAVFGLVGDAKFGGEAGGGALGGGGRVVELVREIGSELTEGDELFGLLVHAGEVADAIQEQSDAALADGWDGAEHLGKEILMDVEHPDGADAAAVCSPGLHAGVGQFSGESGGAADETGHRA